MKPNDKCSCGSGKKFKKCCGSIVEIPEPKPERKLTAKERREAAHVMSMIAAWGGVELLDKMLGKNKGGTGNGSE